MLIKDNRKTLTKIIIKILLIQFRKSPFNIILSLIIKKIREIND